MSEGQDRGIPFASGDLVDCLIDLDLAGGNGGDLLMDFLQYLRASLLVETAEDGLGLLIHPFQKKVEESPVDGTGRGVVVNRAIWEKEGGVEWTCHESMCHFIQEIAGLARSIKGVIIL